MYGYIYKTTNIINNKIYIGQRKSSKFLGNNYLGSGKHLKCAVQKYGRDNFIVEQLDTALSPNELDLKEIEWIAKFDSTNPDIGYNISQGGATPRGLCAWNKGLTKENDARLLQTKETCEKRSKSLKLAYADGRHTIQLSEEARMKMSERAKSRPHPPTTKGRVWVNNGNIQKQVTQDVKEQLLNDGWVLGRLTHNDAWNKGLTKETSDSVRVGVENRVNNHKRDYSGENCYKFKTDDELMSTIVDKGFKEMLMSVGKTKTCKYFGICGYGRVFNRCLFLSGLSDKSE